MTLKTLLTSALLAAPALAHPGHKEKVYAHAALPLERKSLAHCKTKFQEPEFVKRTVEIHASEFHRLRRKRGLTAEEK